LNKTILGERATSNGIKDCVDRRMLHLGLTWRGQMTDEGLWKGRRLNSKRKNHLHRHRREKSAEKNKPIKKYGAGDGGKIHAAGPGV